MVRLPYTPSLFFMTAIYINVHAYYMYTYTACMYVHRNASVACQTVNESWPKNFSPVISRKLFFSSEMQCYVLQVESCAQSSSAAEGVLAAADSALATARAAMR